MDDVTRIGFLGLGQMGAPMAERLFGPDVRLHVFDPRPEAVAPFVARGAVACGSPREVADAAGIVLACLPSGEVSEVVALGPEGVVHGHAIRIHAEMSTIGRPAMERIAAGLGGARHRRRGHAHHRRPARGARRHIGSDDRRRGGAGRDAAALLAAHRQVGCSCSGRGPARGR